MTRNCIQARVSSRQAPSRDHKRSQVSQKIREVLEGLRGTARGLSFKKIRREIQRMLRWVGDQLLLKELKALYESREILRDGKFYKPA